MHELLSFTGSWTKPVYSGFVPVTAILIVLRLTWKTKAKLWDQLLFCSNILLLSATTCFAITLLYSLSAIVAGNNDSSQQFRWRVLGPYWYSYWIMALINLSPLFLWIRKYRHSYKASLLFTLLVALTGLFERIVIIVTSFYRDYLPSSWTYYSPAFLKYQLAWLFIAACCSWYNGINFGIKRKAAGAPPS